MAIQGRKKVELTMDSILNKISDFDIYMKYMPHRNWGLNEVCISPFPKSDGSTESNPSFLIGNKRGYISHILFSDTSYRGDCFAFVKQLYNLSTLDDVLRMIDRDFRLGIVSGENNQEYKKIISQYKQPEITKRNSLIQVVTRKFTKEELTYWSRYGITEIDLKQENIYSIKKLFLNKRLFYLEDLRFGYFYPEGGWWKLYSPLANKKKKWLSNVPLTTLEGKNNLNKDKTAWITKSKKDKMILLKLYPHVISSQNESISCFSQENIDFIQNNSLSQVILYDSDLPGINASKEITKVFNCHYCNPPKQLLPEVKDFSDMALKYSLKEVENFLKNKLLLS